MIPLPVHEHHRMFATEEYPLRASKLPRFVICPMSSFLTHSWFTEEQDGGVAAQTGNLVHSAAAEYHRHQGTLQQREEVARAALEAARAEFPQGDPERAGNIFTRYAADPENQKAEVVWVEQKVTLRLSPSPLDPTGQPVVIKGTLDQVRRVRGKLYVYDIKTGTRLTAEESVAEYLVQQAAYTIAARASLDPNILPGYLIYTPGYEKPRGRRFIPLNLTIPSCMMLLDGVVDAVASIRRGVPLFAPSVDGCHYCDVRPFEACSSMYQGVYR